ncbi:MAG: MAPEG family protein [Pseudomonadota bacterium]
MLPPILHLIVWTLIIWVWMYATRIPAMQKASIDPQDALHPGSLSGLPSNVRTVADNYNHLHEQPTLFYALAFWTHLYGNTDDINIALAWAYVAARIAHSLVQIVVRNVMIRFVLFVVSTLILMGLAVRNVLALAA